MINTYTYCVNPIIYPEYYFYIARTKLDHWDSYISHNKHTFDISGKPMHSGIVKEKAIDVVNGFGGHNNYSNNICSMYHNYITATKLCMHKSYT